MKEHLNSKLEDFNFYLNFRGFIFYLIDPFFLIFLKTNEKITIFIIYLW